MHSLNLVVVSQIFRFSDSNFPNILKLVEGLQNIGNKHNATSGQVSLAWILGQGKDFIPIPGTTRIAVGHLILIVLYF